MIVDTFTVYFVIFVTLPLTWYVTWRLWRLSLQRPRIAVLHERALTSLSIAVIVTIFSLIFINTELDRAIFSNEVARTLGRLATASLCLPAIYWLWLYRHQ